ncbi:Arginine N-methyltransferase 2 [Microsporum canis]|uniref:Arginine N-methyltransferase 2 n=1 Tax=Arthroderma otae (strain ATCC MYA-4605 / CBS 113480) TaxID=554155 RepID=C5FP10_ARTOC|nr:arginine N-methyltransferase 2 [Microsporum canis CBS 113480]EEQ31863.1 arginine N-methyltransferase 2 [Microsporum canis CBS 113480]
MEDPNDAAIGAIDVDLDTQEILLAASQHNIAKLRELIRRNEKEENPANAKDPETGYTPLHAAIAACEPETDNVANGDIAERTTQEQETLEGGVKTVKFLLQEGAIWNDLDANDETPGCMARRLGLTELYQLMVDAGVRAELLLNRLEGYEPLEDEDEEDGEKADITTEKASATDKVEDEAPTRSVETSTGEGEPSNAEDPSVGNEHYLSSGLTFQENRLLDGDKNGVMMAWEMDIMDKSARALLPTPGLRVLNIGHGMGIVDGILQNLKPSAHHIVEAHPAVIADMKSKGWHEKTGVTIHESKWQDILPKLATEGVMFDAIYYDTFAESYSDFRDFASEHVIALLEPEGRWSFFNGMGADRQISYDVYQKVVEMDMMEAGFDVDWTKVPVPPLDGEWEGVRRKYWVVDNYRLPVCRYLD